MHLKGQDIELLVHVRIDYLHNDVTGLLIFYCWQKELHKYRVTVLLGLVLSSESHFSKMPVSCCAVYS